MWIKVITSLLIDIGQKIISALYNYYITKRKRKKRENEVDDAFNQKNPSDRATDLNNAFRK